MSPERQRLAVTAITILAAVTVFYSLRHFGKYQPYADLLQNSDGFPVSRIGISMQEATVEGRSSVGKRLWRVTASVIEISKDRRTVSATKLHNGTTYSSSGDKTLEFSAAYATYSVPYGYSSSTDIGSNLLVNGGIYARATQFGKPVFTTPTLTWDPNRNLIVFPGQVNVNYPNGTAVVKAQNLEYDIQSGNLVAHRITGLFKVDKSLL